MKCIFKILLAISAMSGTEVLSLEASEINQIDSVSVGGLKLTIEQSKQIQIDGFLAESVWQAADAATGLRQQEPIEGAAATERTEVRILFDSHSLYIGVMAFDSQPDKIISRILQRDKLMQLGADNKPQFTGDDAVAVLLDTFNDRRNAVVFATNPNGAECEALITDEGREFNLDWRAIWKVAAKKVDNGWSAEFQIPFRSLRYAKASDDGRWGLNIFRVIRRKNEEVLWSAWSRNNEGFARVSRAGHLNNMAELPRSSLNLEVKPFMLTGLTNHFQNDNLTDTHQLEAGFDAKWEVHPGLLLDLTVNTDFAQVEADDEQINLTRFDLFFPEKRDFFLENSGIFEFGYRSLSEPPPFLLFFSRQIGISDQGTIPVLGGGRLTGRIGNQTIGLLNVMTNEANGEPRTNFAVARVKRDVGGNNYVGAMVTDRRSDLSWNSGLGIDWSFWPSGTLNVQGFVAKTITPDSSGNAYSLGIDYQTGHFGINARHTVIADDATAEMGFISRTDIRKSGGLLRLTTRPEFAGLRAIEFHWATDYVTRLNGELLDWSAGPALKFDWNSGESLNIFYLDSFTRLDAAFDLTNEISVPVGDYEQWWFGWSANSSINRPAFINVNGGLQRFYDGNLFNLGASVTSAFSANFSLSFDYQHNSIDLPQGSFFADLASMRLSYAFSTKLILKALLQYNRLERKLSANLRFNFIHRPGSDLFIVFNEERGGQDLRHWQLTNRGFVTKLTYLKRL